MAFCEYCKNEGQETNACAYCGTMTGGGAATFIYGYNEKECYGCQFTLTDKYLIVKAVSQKEMAAGTATGAAFGLIGVLVMEAAKSAMKPKNSFGFYDLQELQKVIYPYHTGKLKKDTAFKFVNKDGTDFILNFNLNGMFCGKAANTFLSALAKSGVYVENGSNMVNQVCCEKPFLNKDTFGKRICQSAAIFVDMEEEQFITPPIVISEQTPQYAQPVVVAQPIVEPVIETVQKINTPVEDNTTEDKIMCPNCGLMVESTAKFCRSCGKALEQQEEPIDPALLEEVANTVYPGIGIYYRDINLPAQFAEKYITNLIIREKGMTDASNRLGGMVTTHRYIILSNHMGNLSAFEHGTNWGLRIAAKDSHFKVLGQHTYKEKIGIFLLHLPDDEKWKVYKTATFNIDGDVLQRAIQNFEQRIDTAPIPELSNETWLSRCAFPVGMNDNGELWELE